MNNDWINKIANELAEQQTNSFPTQNIFTVQVKFSDQVEVGKVFSALKDKGLPVLDVSAETVKPLPGQTVELTAPLELRSNVVMKTSSALYKIAKVEVPAGYIGEVQKVAKDHATLKIDANVNVIASTSNGDLCTVDYYVETVDVPYTQLRIRKA